MILVGSQRAGAANLAAHLLNSYDNDHVEVAELRGFVADELHGALSEAEAIAKGTRCVQYMFSLSLNPPKEAKPTLDLLFAAAERAEQALGLNNHPRAIVIHEKQGRRHAHVVWSRIDVESMTAVNLPYFKTRLNALSKELYLENGWQLPEGYKTNGWKNPLNFTLAEWQQAKRLDLDPREIKQVFQEAWQRSDNLSSFKAALQESGYHLAKGDRRALVAVDIHENVYAVSRWAGAKAKNLKTKFSNTEQLPSVEEVEASLRTQTVRKLREHVVRDRKAKNDELQPHKDALRKLVHAQRDERARLKDQQEKRWQAESKERANRFRKGLATVLDLLTGRIFALRKQNDAEAFAGYQRDKAQRERLHAEQFKERLPRQKAIEAIQERHKLERAALARGIGDLLRATRARNRQHLHQRGPDQELAP